jgi:chromosome segregation ATPase
VNGYLKQLQREYKALESELQRCHEKIVLYQEEIPKIQKKMEELAEIIAVVSQLPRYQEEQKNKKQFTDSVPQKDGVENGKHHLD